MKLKFIDYLAIGLILLNVVIAVIGGNWHSFFGWLLSAFYWFFVQWVIKEANEIVKTYETR